ncbi:hypothetical protein B0H14DRAFT_2563277 [Mycena olivaceomarginata]|nr:hypothetical protein B0H14DRAFT_2563277 [Mycena olivaceomarginata]
MKAEAAPPSYGWFVLSEEPANLLKCSLQAKAAVADLVTAVVEHNPQEPVGLTPIGKKLQGILPYQHWWSKEPKRKKLYLVVTDGRPSDEKVPDILLYGPYTVQ